jgi:heme/copper-type cytochrome/quinol oxidase subunit 4
MTLSATLADLPVALIAIFAGLALVQVGLDVVALVHLYRTPAAQVAGGNKWLWVVIIVLVNLIGAILYLAIGHRAPPAAEQAAARPSDRMGDIVDSLYGREYQPPPT